MVEAVNKTEETETVVKRYNRSSESPQDALTRALSSFEEEFGDVIREITYLEAESTESPGGYRITVVAQPI